MPARLHGDSHTFISASDNDELRRTLGDESYNLLNSTLSLKTRTRTSFAGTIKKNETSGINWKGKLQMRPDWSTKQNPEPSRLRKKGVIGSTVGEADELDLPAVRMSEGTKTELYATLGDKNFRTLEQTLRISEKLRFGNDSFATNSDMDADGVYRKVWRDAAPPSYEIHSGPHPAKFKGQLYWPHQVEKDATMPYKVDSPQEISSLGQWLQHYGKPEEEKLPPGLLTSFTPSRRRFGKSKSVSSDMRNGRLLK